MFKKKKFYFQLFRVTLIGGLHNIDKIWKKAICLAIPLRKKKLMEGPLAKKKSSDN